MTERRSDRPMAEEVWQLAERLEALLDRLGVAGALARRDGGRALGEALARCRDCQEKAGCAAWITAHAADPPSADDIPPGCPNRLLIEACLGATGQGGRSSE